MSYLTDRKRATGRGSAKTGTEHHWHMMVSSVALAILVPLFIFTFGPMLGAPHAEVVEYFARPFPAIVAALTIVVSMVHFKGGASIMLEDYVYGTNLKIALISVTLLSYAIAATGVFAIARIAL